MDEYRPYPAEPPEEIDEHEVDETPEPPEPTAPAERVAPVAVTQSAGLAEPAMEEEEDVPAGRQRPPRQEPNLEHPGGHLHGVVARMNRPRRFGFLRSDDGIEVFFHASALEAGPNAFDALRPGQEMEWDCHQDEQGRGLAATTVTILGEPPERPPRPPRPERAERPERPERPERGGRQRGGQQTGWRVMVLTERGEQTAAVQLERLLNDRNVKPGSFTFNLTETDDGVECWVAIYSGG